MRWFGVGLLACGLIVLGAGGVSAQTAMVKRQGKQLYNSSTTGAANTAVTTSIAAAASTRVHLHAISAYCSAGSATLTVKDGVAGTTIWVSPAGFVTTTLVGLAWTTPLDSTTGAGMDIVLGTCGGGNTGTLQVQADQY